MWVRVVRYLVVFDVPDLVDLCVFGATPDLLWLWVLWIFGAALDMSLLWMPWVFGVAPDLHLLWVSRVSSGCSMLVDLGFGGG